MANRVILGKATTARGGSTKFGMWISRPTKDVETCSDDELIFDTDSGVNVSRVHGLFMFGAVSVDGSGNTTTNATVNVSASSTATVAIDQGYNYNHGFIGYGSPTTSITGGGTGQLISFAQSGTDLIITNITSTALSNIEVFVIPQFSSSALF